MSDSHSIPRLLASLHRAGLAPDARDVADMLWLAQFLPRSAFSTPAAPPPPSSPLPAVAADPVRPATSPAPAPTPPPPVPPADRPLYVPPATPAGSRRASPIRVPDAPALPNALPLARALRPLGRRRALSRRLQVDEEATIDRYARTRLLLPVLQPLRERWFEAHLVVEQSPSMAFWERTATEFQRLLERHGAFRDVRRWALDAASDPLRLLGTAGAPHPPRELVDPTGRRLLFLVSDAVSPAWYDGRMAGLLSALGRHNPLVLLQALPDRLWARTALGEPSLLAHAPTPGSPNSRLRATLPWLDIPASGQCLPVIPLEPDPAATWARALMAMSGVRTPAIDLLPGPHPEPPAPAAPLSPEQRVRHFRRLASPAAFDLACHLAVVPLRLPVMRVVQHALLRRPEPAQLAEILFGGVIERLTPVTPHVPHEQVEYDFAPGVRDLLLQQLRTEEVLTVLSSVSAYVERNAGTVLDFRALIEDPEGTASLPDEVRPFALLGAEALQRMGFGARVPAAAPQQPEPTAPVTATEPASPLPAVVVGLSWWPSSQPSAAVMRLLKGELEARGINVREHDWEHVPVPEGWPAGIPECDHLLVAMDSSSPDLRQSAAHEWRAAHCRDTTLLLIGQDVALTGGPALATVRFPADESDWPTLLPSVLERLRDTKRFGALWETVPTLPDPYVPRPDTQATVLDFLRDHAQQPGSLLILTGEEQVGKTVFALSLARSCEVRSVFPGGIYWGHTPGTEFPTTTADPALLILRTETPQDARQKATAWTHGPALAICPHLSIQQEGAAVWRLPAITVREIVAFFASRSMADQGNDPEQFVRHLAYLCDGNTKATARVGAWLEHHSPEQAHIVLLDALSEQDRKILSQLKPNEAELGKLSESVLAAASLALLPGDLHACLVSLAVGKPQQAMPLTLVNALIPRGADELFTRSLPTLFRYRLLRRRPDGGLFLPATVYERLAPMLPPEGFAHQEVFRHYRTQPGESWADTPDDGYFLHALSFHLHSAHAVPQLRALLTDLRWLSRRLEQTGVEGVREDFSLLPSDDPLHRITAAFGREADLRPYSQRRFALSLWRVLRVDSSPTPELQDLARQARRELPEESLVPSRWVLVLTGKELPEAGKMLAFKLGARLARAGYGLLVCLQSAVDTLLVTRFARTLLGLSGEGAMPTPSPALPELKTLSGVEPAAIVEKAQALIVIGGADAEQACFVEADKQRKLTLPVAATGGQAQRAYQELLWRAESLPDSYDWVNDLPFLAEPLSSEEDAERMADQITYALRVFVPLEGEDPIVFHEFALLSPVQDYLSSQPLEAAEQKAQGIRDHLQVSPSRPMAPVVGHLLAAPDRVRNTAGYFCCQVWPRSSLILPLVSCLDREQRELEQSRTTRPLWQLLLAVQAAVEDTGLADALPSDTATRLAGTLQFLDERPALDPGGQCKSLLRALLQEYRRHLRTRLYEDDPMEDIGGDDEEGTLSSEPLT